MAIKLRQQLLPPWLRLRREPFEFGLLPFPLAPHLSQSPNQASGETIGQGQSLNSLLAIKRQLAARSEPGFNGHHVTVSGKDISSCMGLSELHTELLMDTVLSLLPPSSTAPPLLQPSSLSGSSSNAILQSRVGLYHLLVILYLQNYRRTAHRTIPTSSALADLWPQAPTAFDTYVAQQSLSPHSMQGKPGLGMAGNASKGRGAQAAAEEEVNEIGFVQKNLSHLLALLAEPSTEPSPRAMQVDSGDGVAEYLVSLEAFESLSILIQSPVPGESLAQSSPFFVDADPAMPPLPVPVSQLHPWLLQHVCQASYSESGQEGEQSNGGSNLSSPSAATAAAAAASMIEGITRGSVLRGEKDNLCPTVRVSHCHDSVIYLLTPLKYVVLSSCSDSIVVLGAASKVVKCDNCERVQVIAACARIRISNCRECVFYLGTNRCPLVTGDNHKIQVAPYNTFYPRLEMHLSQAGVDPTVNHWDAPINLGAADPHNAMEPPAGTADSTPERITLLPPEKFVPFVIPFRGMGSSASSGEATSHTPTRGNPFLLPRSYLTALQIKTKGVEGLRYSLKSVVLDESKKKELTNVIQAHFKEWLLSSGNIRQVYDLTRLDKEF